MRKFYFFSLFSLCFTASLNSDQTPTITLSPTPRTDYILAALCIARSTQTKFKNMRDFGDLEDVNFAHEPFVEVIYLLSIFEFSWWKIQKDIFALLESKENTMETENRLMNGLTFLINFQGRMAFYKMRHYGIEIHEIREYPEHTSDYYHVLSNAVKTFDFSGLTDTNAISWCYYFTIGIPAIVNIILNLHKVFEFKAPEEPVDYYYENARELKDESVKKIECLFSDFDNLDLSTYVRCIHVTTKETWYSPETENLISLVCEPFIQRQEKEENRLTQESKEIESQEPKKAQPQNPKKPGKIQSQPQKPIPQEHELNLNNPILVGHVLKALEIANNNRLLNQHRGVWMKPSLFTDYLDNIPITKNRKMFVEQVYTYLGLEFSWWEIQKDIFALLSSEKCVREAARERLTIGIVAIVHKQLISLVSEMEDILKDLEILEELESLTEIENILKPDPILYSFFIRLVKILIDVCSLPVVMQFYGYIYFTEITAASEIIVLLAGLIKFNTPSYENDYYSRGLKQEVESKITLLRSLKKIESLDFGLLKEFILKTTKEKWYSAETEDLISKFFKTELDKMEIKQAQELEKIRELISQRQELRLQEVRCQEHKEILLECNEPIKQIRNKKTQGVSKKTDKTIETSQETTEEPFWYHSNIEYKERRARLKKEHENKGKNHLKAKRGTKTSKAEISLPKILREVMGPRNLLGLKVDDVGVRMVENRPSFLYTAKLYKNQKFVCSHNPSIILDSGQFKTLCCLFGVIRGVVRDLDFLKLVQGLRCTEIRVTDGSKRVLTIGMQKMSVHKAHTTNTFDWPKARRFCLKAGFSPHSFYKLE